MSHAETVERLADDSGILLGSRHRPRRGPAFSVAFAAGCSNSASRQRMAARSEASLVRVLHFFYTAYSASLSFRFVLGVGAVGNNRVDKSNSRPFDWHDRDQAIATSEMVDREIKVKQTHA